MIVLRYFWQNNYFSVIFVIFERDDEFNYYYIVINIELLTVRTDFRKPLNTNNVAKPTTQG
jgi:hypothetical protein